MWYLREDEQKVCVVEIDKSCVESKHRFTHAYIYGDNKLCIYLLTNFVDFFHFYCVSSYTSLVTHDTTILLFFFSASKYQNKTVPYSSNESHIELDYVELVNS